MTLNAHLAACSSVKKEILLSLRELAVKSILPHAEVYDREGVFPRESIDALIRGGYWKAPIPRIYGGLETGPNHGDAHTLWMMTREIAKADMATARCWEGHVNAMVIIEGLANEAQKARWFGDVCKEGHIWAVWSGEPLSKKPGENGIGTWLERVSGGWRLRGSKVFCSGASDADRAILMVNPAGPGGAREAPAESLLMLACNMHDPTISHDGSWWDPIGMRASVSYRIDFANTFIPDENLIGGPGSYMHDNWQTRFIPQYAATFLGAAEAAYDYVLHYIKTQNKVEDPFIQQHIGKMAINVETAHLWLKHVADLWQTDPDESVLAGSRARHLIEHLALDTVQRGIRACGARALNRPSRLEKIYRDLSFYVRHDNDDHNLATIGKSLLGRDFDPSFYSG